ncbi:MAG TPA: flagellar hook-associated protein FlgL [Terriglobales bacterium]|nr:flagellar hook-associated protein FlgL [Terriglobales bacterium]
MRISTRMFQQGALASLRRGQSSLYAAQEQVASGLRVQTTSDDPQAASRILRLNGQLRDVEQYQRNATEASTRLEAEDTVITSARKLLDQARALEISTASGDPTSPDRDAALEALEQIRQQLVSLGNTRVGNEYLFGGGCTTSPPFRPDGTYVGDATVRQTEIDAGVVVDTNHTGDQLFSNALLAIRDLEDQLSSGSSQQMPAAGPALEDVSAQLLAAQTVNGSRLGQVKTSLDMLTSRAAGLGDTRDSLRSADPTKASVELLAAQSALERAYAAISKVLSTSLVDYLK